MYEKILYPTDGSRCSKNALKHVVEIAKKFGSKVFILHAFPYVPEYIGAEYRDKIVSQSTLEAEKITNEAAEVLKENGIEYEIEILEGPAHKAILNVAEVRKVDLIIMGSRGVSALAGVLLGSVSQRIVTHAKCPVMIVRSREGE